MPTYTNQYGTLVDACSQSMHTSFGEMPHSGLLEGIVPILF